MQREERYLLSDLPKQGVICATCNITKFHEKTGLSYPKDAVAEIAADDYSLRTVGFRRETICTSYELGVSEDEYFGFSPGKGDTHTLVTFYNDDKTLSTIFKMSAAETVNMFASLAVARGPQDWTENTLSKDEFDTLVNQYQAAHRPLKVKSPKSKRIGFWPFS